MATKETKRVLELLKRFNDGQKVSIESLQNDIYWWNDSKQKPMSEKSIRRDLTVLKEHFPESFELIRGEKGCYKAITKDAFDNFINPELLSLMVQTFNIANKSDMFDNLDLNDTDKKILESKIKETNALYEFKTKPLETKRSDRVILTSCERAIKFQKCITIEYNGNKFEVKPYRILFFNENFYLGCEIEHESLEFAMYRVSKIKSIEDTTKTFHKNYEIDDFIKDMQTPFSTYRRDYKKHLIDVKLEVSKEKAFFFKLKSYLKSQKILEEKEDGSLIVGYKVTQEYEMEELVKRWIPHVKVIEPVSLRDKITDELKEYLS